jgi:hypothetical protein
MIKSYLEKIIMNKQVKVIDFKLVFVDAIMKFWYWIINY